jgi:thioredoxin reductase (NADPH)
MLGPFELPLMPEAPEPGQTYDLLVVGGGPAGLTAALYGARAGLSTAVLDKGPPGGLMATTERVENCPGCIEGTGADIGRHLLRQGVNFGAKYATVEVSAVDVQANPKQVAARDDVYLGRAVIIATGSNPRRLNIPGEQEYWGRGVSFCSTCDAPFFKDKPIAVVGGGGSGLQESDFLLRYVSHLTVLQDLDHLTAGRVLQDRVLGHPNVTVRLNTVVREIKGNAGVQGVLVEDTRSGAREELPVEGVFIFIGLLPSSELVKGQLELDEQGYVLTTAQMETNIPGVYAAGDIRQGARRQIVTAASDGAVAAMSAIDYLEQQQRGG